MGETCSHNCKRCNENCIAKEKVAKLAAACDAGMIELFDRKLLDTVMVQIINK